jgi:RNA polymerase sigma factor (sigma-70 family)
MTNRHLQTVLLQLHQRAADALPDRDLLDRFVAHADQDAFTALVERHGPMVLCLCRRVLGHAHDAEDACQAAFLVLARKAASIRKKDALASWLHGVAFHAASNLRRDTARHRDRPVPHRQAPPADPAGEVTWREVKEALDEELARLPERYRAPLVLCYLEGRTRDEAAQLLGWSEGTCRGRLERGREVLRARLVRRGLGLSAALLAGALGQEAASASVAPPFVTATVQAASRFAAGRGAAGLIPTRVACLAEGVLQAMFVNKLRTAAVALLVLGAVALTGALLARGQNDKATDGSDKPAAEPQAAASAPPAAPAAARTLRVVVLDPQGKPVPGADIHAGVWTEEKGFRANRDYQTDAAGAARVELPKSYTILRLWAGKKPYVTLFAGWEQEELASGKRPPAEYTFRLESGVSAGGRIVDEQGKPIAGARVQVRMATDPRPAQGDGRARYNTWLAEGDNTPTTDADGRWRIDRVPSDPGVLLSLLVSHPDYVSDTHWGEAQQASGVTALALRQGTATLTLKRGVIVRGQVTDPAGKPIKGAVVVYGDHPYFASLPCKFPTDADGRFRLPALAPAQTTLTVIAPGWAPQLRKVTLRDGLPPQDFRMGPGKPIRLRVVDAAGKPVPGAYVQITGWKGSESLQSMHNPNHPRVPDTKIPGRANADGVWEWASAPDDPVTLQVSSKGFAAIELQVAGGAPERTVTLKGDHRITGRVTDAATGKAIPAFTVMHVNVFRKDFLGAERSHARAGKGGRLDYLTDRTDVALRLRVEAMGYRTQDGPEFRVGEDASRVQDFRLQPSAPVTGVVLDAAGRPAAGAEVLLATPTEQATLHSDWGNHKTTTDAAGRFAFPDPGEPWAVVARSGAGFALAEFPSGGHDAGTLRLRPWASVRGRFQDGGHPVRGTTVLLQVIRLNTLDRPRIDALIQAVTGPDGRFDLGHVPPGPVSVRVHLGPWKDEGFRSGPSVPLDLQPGERVELDLGGAGAVVTGKVKLTGKVPADLDCTYSLNHLVRREPGIAPPHAVAALGFDVRHGWRDTWLKSAEGQTYLDTLRYWFVKLAPDGTFRISGVPPGEYDLAVAVYAKPSGCLVDPLARQVVRVTVPSTGGEVALPEIAAAVVPVPAVGDTPALAFERADGTAGTLADCRGRYTVVHFWASWCGPCKQQLPAVRHLRERFADRGVAVLGLSLDEDAAAWQGALKRLDLPGPQGRLAADSAAGVSSVPAYWVLDPAGKLIGKAFDPDEVATLLADRMK